MTAPTSHGAAGGPITTKDAILETGASATQPFEPIRAICAHLNAFHVYASDPSRSVEANHYCTHLSADVRIHLAIPKKSPSPELLADTTDNEQQVRQCLIYDAPTNPARLIGVEYMITPSLYQGLDEQERRLWHSHDYEVRSGMLIMPNPNVPNAIWEVAETAEMKEVIGLYGKTYHFWQVDRGDVLPLGKPELMMSFVKDEQVPWDKIKDRDERNGVATERKREIRNGIEGVSVHEDADGCWKN
ncbi:DUF1264 domain protein [Marssonina coronariae]|uniref:DUF1264 domain protein n=1 Tax=Diplocarpon coronariae TaxID=2795749 RepID=A0A218ZIW7_9HELO|nr:DUF1264 domain protein [Marssonina coronariae]